jgi:Fe-S cluster assembly protein SufB
LVRVNPKAQDARNYTQCDSLLVGHHSQANTLPVMQVHNPTARVEHEASTSKIGEEQLFYCQQRGLDTEAAVAMMISGFCRDVFNQLPMEFAVEADRLLSLKLEGTVG